MAEDDSLIVDNPAPGIRTFTFNRPDSLNAFDMAMFARFEEELAKAAADEDVRAIIIGARGGRSFSAGFDIHEMAKFDAVQMRQAFEARDPVIKQVALHPKPVIAAVDGICYGGGALVALAADIRVATPALRFKVTAVSYGGANATWSLPPLVGPARAKEILMTGRVIESDEALSIGLVNRIVPSDTLWAEAMSIATAIAEKPAAGIAGIKQLVDARSTSTAEQGWQAEFDWMLSSMESAGGGSAVFDGFLSDKKKKD